MTLTLVRRIDDASGVTLEFANDDNSVNVTFRVNNRDVNTDQYERGKQYQVSITSNADFPFATPAS